MKITIHCGHCSGTFDWEHPAVNHAAQLKNFGITCSWCGITLRMPANEVHMIPESLPANVTSIRRRA